MSLNLYQLTDKMIELMQADDVSNEQIEETFGAITDKSAHICHFLADLHGEIDKFKAEEERIQQRRKAMENKEKRLKEYIKESMVRLDINSLKTGTFSLTLSPSAGAVEIINESEIPAKFKTIVTSTTIDKSRIKQAIAAGESVPGATIETGYTLRIR